MQIRNKLHITKIYESYNNNCEIASLISRSEAWFHFVYGRLKTMSARTLHCITLYRLQFKGVIMYTPWTQHSIRLHSCLSVIGFLVCVADNWLRNSRTVLQCTSTAGGLPTALSGNRETHLLAVFTMWYIEGKLYTEYKTFKFVGQDDNIEPYFASNSESYIQSINFP